MIRATAQQQAAREAFASGADLALIAGAGAGKASTLHRWAEPHPACAERGAQMTERCRHDLPTDQCGDCRKPPEGLAARVVASATSSAPWPRPNYCMSAAPSTRIDVSGMVAMEESRDATPPRQARVDLWAKLLNGGVTEVYVPGFETYAHASMRGTLGLEPIVSRAYEYDREGVPRDAAELAEVARQLAAEPRWIAGGGPWFWDAHFAERAEVILDFDVYDGQWHRRQSDPTAYADRVVRWLAHRVRSRRRHEPGVIEGSSPLDAPFLQAVSGRGALSPIETAAANVRAQHPEKVFLVREWNRDRRLDTVRAHQ